MTTSTVYLLGLASNLFFSTASMVFSTYVKRFSPLWMNQMKVVVAMTGFAGAVVYTGMVPVTHVALACLLASGVIGLCVADILLFRAFQTLGVARTLVLFSFQPMVLGIYGVLFLSQGLNLNQAGAINTYQSNVWFPTQATAPDFWFGITTSVVTNDGTTYTVVSYTDHLFVEVKVVSATLTTVPYLIFRKRLSG